MPPARTFWEKIIPYLIEDLRKVYGDLWEFGLKDKSKFSPEILSFIVPRKSLILTGNFDIINNLNCV